MWGHFRCYFILLYFGFIVEFKVKVVKVRKAENVIYWSRLKYMDVLGPFQIVFCLDNFCNGIFNMVLFLFQLNYLVKGC
jgi:hypothetical protein